MRQQLGSSQLLLLSTRSLPHCCGMGESDRVSIDLARHSRLLLYNRPKHTLLYRWLGLYPLYLLAEVAIIATDLAELLGSAIALCMLFPRLELWHGVLITGFDVILILAMGDPLRGRPVRLFEFLIAGMQIDRNLQVIAVLVCMVVVISKVDVNWGHAFQGYIPSKYIFQSGGLYTSVGILGATVMPHSLFIGSALATQDRIEFREAPKDEYFEDDAITTALCTTEAPPSRVKIVWRSIKKNVTRAFRRPPLSNSHRATRHSEQQNNPFEFVKAHLYHGIVDVVASLLGFAVLINSLILILASAVFFYGSTWDGNGDPASLFDAYDLIRDIVGKPAATLFAIALLASGQPIMRRLLTRLLAIIPSTIVAVATGRKGVDALLVASQVVLSVVLPFITFPLLWCTSSKAIMSVRKRKQTPIPQTPLTVSGLTAVTPLVSNQSTSKDKVIQSEVAVGPTPADLSSSPAAPGVESTLVKSPNPDTQSSTSITSDSSSSLESAEEYETVDYSNTKFAIVVGALIWLVVVAANVYVIVDLARSAAS
ncbi:hypothetical protein D9611_007561 [Ephemerocybe angulata]|uniref:Uncharacterized protein n=1 Tax=Ephemerocybe angulata TaxID=980116 RepID=A0A8H5BZW5_9AGAR|nr:hypothetical protein D9611_007561 [Tulosesus angulatus]